MNMPIPLPPFEPGTVWLVGAGPGDPGLLTLLAVHALSQADAIVYDALVSPAVMALANPAAELESMGKRGGHASPRQTQINDRLVELARAGKKVLRLKGGDPFVFGRGAEEAVALAEAGIRFRVVPGVTAGVGGLAYAGIPTTARNVNSAVAFVTGHGQDGEVPDGFDWEGLARGAPVMVFYMALRQLDRVVERLVAAGRSPDEPAAVVSRACTPSQTVLVTTLGRLVADVAEAKPEPPSLLVVGGVVDYRRLLDWWTPGS
jgi:uroporphyrin-III C-methyltransferase